MLPFRPGYKLLPYNKKISHSSCLWIYRCNPMVIYIQKHCGRFDRTEIIFKNEYPARSNSQQPGTYQYYPPQANQMCLILISKLISFPIKDISISCTYYSDLSCLIALSVCQASVQGSAVYVHCIVE